LSGVVAESQFLGDHYRIKLQVCGETPFEFSGDQGIPTGERVSLKLKAQDLILLAE